MPTIGGGEVGKTYAAGFWQSQLCDNSLASFPTDVDFSWGIISFTFDGCDNDNFVEVKILSIYNDVLQTFKYISNGKKKIDLSQFSNISSTDNIKIRVEVTTFV